MPRSPRQPGRRTACLCSPTTSSLCRRKQVLLYLPSQTLNTNPTQESERCFYIAPSLGTRALTGSQSPTLRELPPAQHRSLSEVSLRFFLSVDIITKVQLDVTGKTTSYTPTPTASHLSVPRSPYSSLGRSSSTSYSSSSNASYSSSYSTYNSSYSSGRGTTPYSSYRSYL